MWINQAVKYCNIYTFVVQLNKYKNRSGTTVALYSIRRYNEFKKGMI